MTLVTTTGRAKRYALYDGGGNAVTSGVLSGTDYLATSLAVAADEDENAFVAALDAADYPPLPEAGTPLEQDDIYSYGDQVVIVRQSHIRTTHAPVDVPALFIFYQAGAGTLGWIAGEQVYVGTRRTYDGAEYQCIQAHVTQADWTPPTVPALWGVVAANDGTWQPLVDYAVGDVVTYNGAEYKCIQAHTSQPDWTPDATPTLWSLVPTASEWAAGVAYVGDNTAGAGNGDVVTYGGAEYRCLQSHTSLPGWEPPSVPALWTPL